MEKSVFTPHYDRLREKLLQMRTEAGLTQRDLAERLGRERSFVGRIETGDRRVDLVEWFWICEACDQDPEEATAELMRAFRGKKRKRRS